MTRRLAIGGWTLVAVLSLALLGCASPGGPDSTPSDSPAPDSSSTPIPSVGHESRFVIDCVYPDGSAVGTFSRLEEAWASTNYVRIDHCDAHATSDDVELTAEEAAIAEVAAKDLPGEASLDLYLHTLAACVRIAPDAAPGIDTSPTSLLQAALQLCPEAPHAGLIATELSEREG
jgi:hypothetical protein